MDDVYKAPTHCTCGETEEEEHTCPFAEEIHQCYETCTCCAYCEYQCAMDI